MATKKTVAVLPGPQHPKGKAEIAFSPDGNFLAILSEQDENKIAIHDLATKTIIGCQGHAKRVNAFAFSRDGKTLASTSDDGSVKLWDASSGKCVDTLRLPAPHSIRPYGVAFHPNGRTLATCDGEITLWDLRTRRWRNPYHAANPYTKSRFLNYSGDGKLLAAHAIGLWDTATARKIENIDQPWVVSPDGKYVAGTGTIWSAAAGK